LEGKITEIVIGFSLTVIFSLIGLIWKNARDQHDELKRQIDAKLAKVDTYLMTLDARSNRQGETITKLVTVANMTKPGIL
jgi:hypothetical protein